MSEPKNGSTHVKCQGGQGCEPFHKTDRFIIGSGGGHATVKISKAGKVTDAWVDLIDKNGNRIKVAGGRIFTTGQRVNLSPGQYVIDPELRWSGWVGRDWAKCTYFIHWKQN